MLLSLVIPVIPTIDNAKIKRTIHSIFSSIGWSINDCEVIVVANNCSRSSYENLFKEFSVWTKKGRIKMLFLENATISLARNTGLKASQGEYIIHIDSDCRMEKDYLKNLREHIDKERFLIGKGVVKFIPMKNLLSKANCQLKNLVYSSRKSVCYTPNLVVKSNVYKQVGLFDEKIFHGEDNEWSLRSKKFKIEPLFFNDLVLEHFDPKNAFKILMNYFHYGAARVYRFKKLLKKKEGQGGWENLSFFWRLFDEIPNLQEIHSFSIKLLILFLYFIRNIGVTYGLLKWRW